MGQKREVRNDWCFIPQPACQQKIAELFVKESFKAIFSCNSTFLEYIIIITQTLKMSFQEPEQWEKQ